MAELVYGYAPNRVNIADTANSTAWHILASDGITYTTLALLLAAGKKPWPGLDPGMSLQSVQVRSDNGSGAPGSGFWFKTNLTTAPADDNTAVFVPAGGSDSGPCPFWNIWIQKVVGTDRVYLEGAY